MNVLPDISDSHIAPLQVRPRLGSSLPLRPTWGWKDATFLLDVNCQAPKEVVQSLPLNCHWFQLQLILDPHLKMLKQKLSSWLYSFVVWRETRTWTSTWTRWTSCLMSLNCLKRPLRRCSDHRCYQCYCPSSTTRYCQGRCHQRCHPKGEPEKAAFLW